MVRGAVVSNQSGPVNSQHNVQPQKAHIFHQLVIASLQEGGIQHHNRHRSLLGQAAGHGHGMFLRNSHIKCPGGKAFLEVQNAGSPGHCRRNGTDPGIFLGKLFQAFSQGIGEGFYLRGKLFPCFRVKFANAMELGRVFFRKRVAFSLLGQDMEQYRLVQILRRRQQGNQARQIVAIHRPQVSQAHIFKHGFLQEQLLDPVFHPAAGKVQCLPARQLLHHPPVCLLGSQVMLAGTKPGQMLCKTAHIAANRHFVVIQNDDHGLTADSGVIQALIGHPAGAGSIADQSHHVVILAQHGSGPGHSQGNGNGVGCVPRYKGVAIAFLRLGKTGNSPVLPQKRKTRLAACQQLMHIRLVTHVKNQAVFRCIKNGLNGYAQLYNSQVSGKMSAGFRHGRNQEFPDLPAQLGTLRVAERLQILVTVDSL